MKPFLLGMSVLFFFTYFSLGIEASEEQLHFNRPGVHRAVSQVWHMAPLYCRVSRAVLFPTLLPKPF